MKINFILGKPLVKVVFNHIMEGALDEFVKNMTGGSLIYGMLMNNLNPEKLFFKDSSPFDLVDKGRKPKKLNLPLAKKITLSVTPKLQTRAFLRQYNKRKSPPGRHSLDFAATYSAGTPAVELCESPCATVALDRVYSRLNKSPKKSRPQTRLNASQLSPMSPISFARRPETRAGNHIRTVLNRRTQPP